MTKEDEVKISDEKSDVANKLSAIGWGLSLVWIGLAMFLRVDQSIIIPGIGVIILAIQGLRRYNGLKLEGFWVVIGAVFIFGGLWEALEEKLPMGPIVLMAAGVVLIIFASRGKYLSRKK